MRAPAVRNRKRAEEIIVAKLLVGNMKSVPKSKHKKYKSLLENKADELQRSMSAQRVSQVVARKERSSEEGDLSQQSHEEWIFLNRNTLEMKLLRQVQDALRRIADGGYGICHECEEPISPKRLDAVPWARYCVACQEELARRASIGENEDHYQEAER